MVFQADAALNDFARSRVERKWPDNHKFIEYDCLKQRKVMDFGVPSTVPLAELLLCVRRDASCCSCSGLGRVGSVSSGLATASGWLV